MKLIGVGACYLDTILTVDHYPAEDSKLRASSKTTRRGGNCPNTLEVLQQFINLDPECELKAYMCSVLPRKDSQAVKLVRESFSEGLDLDTCCVFRENEDELATSYIIRSIETESRTIVNHNNVRKMEVSEFKKAVKALGDDDRLWFHFEGREVDDTLACMKYVRSVKPDAGLSVEVEKPGRVGLLELAAEADMVFFSKSWAVSQGFESAEQCLYNYNEDEPAPRRRILCCTWGSEGAEMLIDYGPEKNHACMASGSNAWVGEGEVVDTVGAGDTFIAGVLYWLLKRDALEFDRHRFEDVSFAVDNATVLASKKCYQEGFQGLVSRETIKSEKWGLLCIDP